MNRKRKIFQEKEVFTLGNVIVFISLIEPSLNFHSTIEVKKLRD